jgi:hypothetical protein
MDHDEIQAKISEALGVPSTDYTVTYLNNEFDEYVGLESFGNLIAGSDDDGGDSGDDGGSGGDDNVSDGDSGFQTPGKPIKLKIVRKNVPMKRRCWRFLCTALRIAGMYFGFPFGKVWSLLPASMKAKVKKFVGSIIGCFAKLFRCARCACCERSRRGDKSTDNGAGAYLPWRAEHEKAMDRGHTPKPCSQGKFCLRVQGNNTLFALYLRNPFARRLPWIHCRLPRIGIPCAIAPCLPTFKNIGCSCLPCCPCCHLVCMAPTGCLMCKSYDTISLPMCGASKAWCSPCKNGLCNCPCLGCFRRIACCASYEEYDQLANLHKEGRSPDSIRTADMVRGDDGEVQDGEDDEVDEGSGRMPAKGVKDKKINSRTVV